MARMVHKPRILIVEDESGIADTIQYVLSTDGFAPQ
jgi:two-component system, OmpR family, catabolic regulation response regulator CreB